MNKGASNTTYIIIALIIGAGIFYYFYSSGNKTSADATAGGSTVTQTKASADAASVAVGSDILSLYNKITSLKIEPAIFLNPAYQSLIDFSIAVPPENVGRPNPFAPLAGTSQPITASTTARARR